jgi:hypothetical protein
MDKLQAVFKVVLTLAALAAVPVATWIQGHEAANAIVGFVAALLALFLPQPTKKLAAKKPEVDL